MNYKYIFFILLAYSIYTGIADYHKFTKWQDANKALSTMYHGWHSTSDLTQKYGPAIDSLHKIVQSNADQGNMTDSQTRAAVDSIYDSLMRDVKQTDEALEAINELSKFVNTHEPLWHRIYRDFKRRGNDASYR